MAFQKIYSTDRVRHSVPLYAPPVVPMIIVSAPPLPYTFNKPLILPKKEEESVATISGAGIGGLQFTSQSKGTARLEGGDTRINYGSDESTGQAGRRAYSNGKANHKAKKAASSSTVLRVRNGRKSAIKRGKNGRFTKK